MQKTMASDLTLITGIGLVPMTRSEVAAWRRRLVINQRSLGRNPGR